MIEIRNLCKTYSVGDGKVQALKQVSLSIPDGDIFGIIGMSGAGKSTLVRCINYLEPPTSGTVEIDGRDLSKLSSVELRGVRREVTMIFQGFNLLLQRTCLKNVCFPLELSGVKKAEAQKRGRELLKLVGLESKADAYPAQLSGGQQQRVAIARALATRPKVLLCDEATSALDPTTTHSILELIRDINRELGITVIVITHQMSVVESICRHVAILDEGEVVEQGEVSEVFSAPKSPAAKRLMFPMGSEEETVRKEHTIRLFFDGTKAGSPLISRMAIEKGIEANIISASTRTLEGKPAGVMLLSIPGGEQALKDALEYLGQEPGVLAEEVAP